MSFVQFLKSLKESAPANAIGTGYIAGVGIAPGGAVDSSGAAVDMDSPDSDVDDMTDILARGIKSTYQKLAKMSVVDVGDFEFPEKSCAISDIPGGKIHEFIRLNQDEEFIIKNTHTGQYVKAAIFGENIIIKKINITTDDFAPLTL